MTIEIILTTKEQALHNEIENLIASNGGTIKSTVWQSTHNSYVCYEYKPFCPDGFSIKITVDGDDNTLKFISTLVSDRLKTVKFLNSCLAIA